MGNAAGGPICAQLRQVKIRGRAVGVGVNAGRLKNRPFDPVLRCAQSRQFFALDLLVGDFLRFLFDQPLRLSQLIVSFGQAAIDGAATEFSIQSLQGVFGVFRQPDKGEMLSEKLAELRLQNAAKGNLTAKEILLRKRDEICDAEEIDSKVEQRLALRRAALGRAARSVDGQKAAGREMIPN